MSTQLPPKITIFNGIYFNSQFFSKLDDNLTYYDAQGLFLEYPSAQGDETTNFNFTVNGLLNQNGVAFFNNYVQMKQTLVLNSSTASQRQIDNTTYNMIDRVGNVNVGSIYADTANFYYDCNGNSKSHIFSANTSTGVQTTLLEMNVGAFIVNSTNPITTPLAVMPAYTDSSNKVPTTAWVQGAITSSVSTQKTYTTFYNITNTTAIIPANCIAFDIIIKGAGGRSGNSADTGVGTNYNSGGSGSGGNTATYSKIPVSSGRILGFAFNNSTGATSDISIDGIYIVKVFNGNIGGNATSIGVGTAGQINQTPPLYNSAYGTCISYYGSIGSAGLSNAIPTTAGSPLGITFSDGTTGCGQRHLKSATNDPATTALGNGGCWITYYLT